MIELRMNNGMVHKFSSYQELLDHTIILDGKHSLWITGVDKWAKIHHIIQDSKLLIKTTFSDEPMEVGEIVYA